MRFTISIIFSIISLSLRGQGGTDNFKVKIDESVMTGHSYYEITQDSIVMRARHYWIKTKTTKTTEFTKALTKDEGQKLKKAFTRINLKRLKDSYYGKDVSDDNYEFEFIFNSNGTETRTNIYEYKHKDIFEFVRQVNLLIGNDFSIHYDERYCNTNAR